MNSSSATTVTAIGVGFDTARYGHHVTFLGPDLQPACPAFEFPESHEGYQRVRQTCTALEQRFGAIHLHIRLDAAGQYATNLEAFLQQLPFPKTLTVGDPARNQHYRQALFPKRKADPVESLCAARFALVEQPTAAAAVAPAFAQLREIASRLQAQVRQSTRLTNQLHNLLSRVFPELAATVAELQANWVLLLLDRYPTPQHLARARRASLTALPFVTEHKAEQLQRLAAGTVGSLRGDTAAMLVQQLVRQLQDSQAHERRLTQSLADAYHALPTPNHLDTIPGIGATTAAVLTAKIVAIDRFATPAHLVSYFGVFPEEDASGLDRDGSPKPSRHTAMSRQGNDLVRKYLWNAARVGALHNPALKALYHRLRAHGQRGDVALGHCMRKLLHLVFAVWKTGKPFDPNHYPWLTPTHVAAPRPTNEKTAGHNQETHPDQQVVTAADSTLTSGPLPSQAATRAATPTAAPTGTSRIDFAALRGQLSMEQVLAELGWLSKLKGSGPQRRGPCPVHAPHDPRNRSFSVHLGKKVCQCFHPPCALHGNVLDLWAAVHKVSLVEAAHQLVERFALDLR